MVALVFAVLSYCRAFFLSRHCLGLEVAALRQQLVVFKRKQPRPRLLAVDRAFWVALRRLWPGWASALIIVKPDTGGRRGDMARVRTRPGGATERPARADPWRGVPSATITKSLDPEKRWKATTIGYRGVGRQSRTARGGDGSQPNIERGLSGVFVWFPARAQPAQCTGRTICRNHAQESELGARSRYPGIFGSCSILPPGY